MSCERCRLAWQSECSAEEERLPVQPEASALYQSLLALGADNPGRYARHRLWALMFWRPLYLVACVVCCQDSHVDLSEFRLHWAEGTVVGFSGVRRQDHSRFASSTQHAETAAERSQRGAEKQMTILVRCCDQLLASVSELKRINRRFALQLVLDALLERLAALDVSPDQSLKIANAFVQATNETLGLAVLPGHWQPDYQRQSCCLHYLKSANDLCPGCPRNV
ncbi:hypothetical protein [Thalassolituus maritimus]|uniref:hypothetical protein n=1 Tax=Thalassolituus maritimus TaxID=484498 RepID=UPI001115A750|nr:hypothetical protein [Thalassolituus maritimus]